MDSQGTVFKETILKQIKEYLDGKITKEEYYAKAEPYYTKYAQSYRNVRFHKHFLETVANACNDYIEEPGLTPEINEQLFYQALSKAYLDLQKI
ncbi:MAG: hypothetical protein ACI4RN_01545 [Oscillospiraceae bacterium]